MNHAHAIVAFVAFQVVWGLAGGFVSKANDGRPEDLSAIENRMKTSAMGTIASALVLAAFVVGIIVLVDLASGVGWCFAIAILVGSWILSAFVSIALRRSLHSGLGDTLPGLIALPLLPFFALWAWFAS